MAEGRRVIDGSLIAMCVLLAALAVAAWLRGGEALVLEGFTQGGRLLLRFGLVIVVSFLAAGFAELLIPTDWVRANLGSESGLVGILLGVGAGIVTPAGPFVSMPIAAAMLRLGAGAGVVVAFLSSWALLALHRFVAWEIPILGWRFAALRYGVCVALPIGAGLLARAFAAR